MTQQPQISAPAVEHHTDGARGVERTKPRLSWKFTYPKDYKPSSTWTQAAYDVEVSREGSKAELHHVKSAQSVLVPWPSKDLKSREIVEVRVRCYQVGKNGSTVTGWSPSTTLEAAFLEKSDWSATFIASSKPCETASGALRPVQFQKSFTLPHGNKITRARLYSTAHGVYDAYLNGSKIGDQRMAPGWTSYHHRLNYQIYDVTSQLQSKDNVLTAEVGAGWFAGRMSFNGGSTKIYGPDLAFFAQLEICFEDKSDLTIVTDDSWKCHPSNLLASDIYDGETVDFREKTALETAELGAASWIKVKTLPLPNTKLVAPEAPPVRVTEEVSPIDIIITPKGKTVLDFGQNLVGVLQIESLHLPSGHEITIVHTEVMENGEVATRPLRTAVCTDKIIGSGKKLHRWSPKFTFHGFRYAQVEGWPGTLGKKDVTALVMHTDMKRRGYFSCSEALVNKLHDNVLWSMKGNFLSIPTDCPQRDERMGWTGDIQVFAETANFLYDTTGMLSGWLKDVSAEQLARDDKVPGLVVPDIILDGWAKIAQAVWHDVVIMGPFDLYCASGDATILENQYPSMKAYLEVAIPRGRDQLWDSSVWQLGDWLDPSAPPDDPGNGRTDGVIVADCYLVHITSVFAFVCQVLGYTTEAVKYGLDAERLKKTFQDKYITPLGFLVNQTQTALSLALKFGLYPDNNPAQLAVAGESLALQVRRSQYRIATGFAGTPVICHALTQVGESQLAYRMLLEKHCPSWLYPVTMGATTIWERWDSMLPDGRINPGSMTSFNHYALGAVASWLHSTVGGISSKDGWKTIIVAPVPGGTIRNAKVAFDGPYGLVECKWTLEGTHFVVNLTIPPNSIAVVTLPRAEKRTMADHVVGSGQHTFSSEFVAAAWPPRYEPAPFWGVGHCDCP